jgi:hypothetical protein
MEAIVKSLDACAAYSSTFYWHIYMIHKKCYVYLATHHPVVPVNDLSCVF